MKKKMDMNIFSKVTLGGAITSEEGEGFQRVQYVDRSSVILLGVIFCTLILIALMTLGVALLGGNAL